MDEPEVYDEVDVAILTESVVFHAQMREASKLVRMIAKEMEQ